MCPWEDSVREWGTNYINIFCKILSTFTFSTLFCLHKFSLQGLIYKSQSDEKKANMRRLELEAFGNFHSTISSKFNVKQYFKNFFSAY